MKTKEVIDAVALGIEGLAGLPARAVPTFKYFRPLSLAGPTGQMVPALSVAPSKIDVSLQDTQGGYEYKDRLLVTWYAGVMSDSGVQLQDPALAAATLGHVKLITDLLAGWSAALPGISYQSEATMGDVHFGHIHGGIWAAEISLAVTTWEL